MYPFALQETRRACRCLFIDLSLKRVRGSAFSVRKRFSVFCSHLMRREKPLELRGVVQGALGLTPEGPQYIAGASWVHIRHGRLHVAEQQKEERQQGLQSVHYFSPKNVFCIEKDEPFCFA